MKYVFEKYEFSNRGRIFHGYESVEASSKEEAATLAQDRVGEGILLHQIFVPQQ